MLVERRAGVAIPDPLESDKTHDMELVIPLKMIREHCKIDDVETVSDYMINFYRMAAVEAAEEYTGLILKSKRWITELVSRPSYEYGYGSGPPFFWYKTQHMIAHPIGYYYGITGMMPNQIGLQVGSSRAKLPIIQNAFGIGCCNPCRQDAQEKFMYMSGYDCENSIPVAFVLGALKYIAHVIANPGDVATAQLATGSRTSSFDISLGSNPSVASGAIEIWRMIRKDAI